MMTYEKTLEYLYERTPAFHQIGPGAYKPGLERAIELDEALGKPHQQYRTIHVAGTNGKGSVSHLLAAILSETKCRVGLYTSPHLVDFAERIRVNGRKISHRYVIDFVHRYRSLIETLQPSFFELTSAMAFDYFRHKKVDFAIIETGLGGRLDSTNIIFPMLSVITNVSLDHVQLLGNTPEQIATEKAGIIKLRVPVVIGEAPDRKVAEVFHTKASQMRAPIYLAEDRYRLTEAERLPDGRWQYQTQRYGTIEGELSGQEQEKNARTVLTALEALEDAGLKLSPRAVASGFSHVTRLTGLMGRWQVLNEQAPMIVCDTGHNVGAWQYLTQQLERISSGRGVLRMIIGMANDKEIDGMLALMPVHSIYYFTQASIARAFPSTELAERAERAGLVGRRYSSVIEAVAKAINDAGEDDIIFIGGSNFVVAEALLMFPQAIK